MARILFIVDELPAPPRNGVTIPAHAFIEGLIARGHNVDLLALLNRAPDEVALERNKALVERLHVVIKGPRSGMTSMWREIVFRECFFAPSTTDISGIRDALQQENYDVIWATPISAAACLADVDRCLTDNLRRLRVAQINDTYIGTLRSYGNQVFGKGWPLTFRARNALQWVRSWFSYDIENKMLSHANAIIVESASDRDWLRRTSEKQTARRIHIISNGVSSALLDDQLAQSQGLDTGYIGTMSHPRHARTARWILDDVLPLVRKKMPSSRVSFLGGAGSNALMSRIRAATGADHISHVEDIGQYYNTLQCTIIRNYKNIGLINRTLEAMASGVIVIGERGAFNGIDQFENGVHGIIADCSQSVADAIVKISEEPGLRKRIASSARHLIKTHFKWSDRIDQVDKMISQFQHNEHPDGNT